MAGRVFRAPAALPNVEDRKEVVGLVGLRGFAAPAPLLTLKPFLFAAEDVGREVLAVIGLSGVKKLDRLRPPGVGGSCAKLPIVLSESDGRDFRAVEAGSSSTLVPCWSLPFEGGRELG